MDLNKEMFVVDGEWSPKKITEWIMQYPSNTEEIIKFVLHSGEFEMKKAEMERRHHHEKKELYEEYGVPFNC